MPKRMVFVISVLGQDEFWNGGGTTGDITSAIIYSSFAAAESELGGATAQLQGDWGPAGLEIRQIMSTI